MKIIFIAVMMLSVSVAADETEKVEAAPPIQSDYEQFKECTAVTSWLLQGSKLDGIEESKRIKIPLGWKVVGTNVSSNGPIFFICR